MAGVCVVGAGYVGLVTAACLADLGHRVVTCVEIDPERLSMLRRGHSPIREPGLDEMLKRSSNAGRLRFTDSYRNGLAEASFVIITVQTPAGARGETDTSFVESALDMAKPHMRPGSVVMLKSTVPPGTGDAIASALASAEVEVVSNPEFLRQGSAIEDFVRPDRIVIGADSESAERAVRELYAGIEAPVFRCSRRSAEMAKYAANAFLAARISLVNEVAGICDSAGADIEEVTAIVGADRRVGSDFLAAGLGWGGSCFPKDVTALIDTAEGYGCSHDMLDAVYRVNVGQREVACRYLTAATEGRSDPCVAVLGLAFKPNTGDVRGSPALEIIARLLEDEIRVHAHDPVAMEEARRALPNIRYAQDPYTAVDGADAVLLATEWDEYLRLDWRRVRGRMRGDMLVDGRNALDSAAMGEAGFRYIGFGRPSAAARQPLMDHLPVSAVRLAER
jgi:UDPglucose 6-dehydrogenase